MSEWISVKDRLPEDDGWFLVSIFGWVTLAFYDEHDSIFNDFKTCMANNSQVTHWMPLPEPPEED